jgi:hypothetical protein
MQLLSQQTFKTDRQKEIDAELKESYLRKQRILAEITKFNLERDTLEKGMKLLEEDFNQFCYEINNKRGLLQAEIKQLEAIKDSLQKNAISNN